MPQSPNFSSPNISSDAEPITPASMMEDETTTDITAMPGTDAGAVITAAAAMTEDDAPVAVGSGAFGSSSADPASRTRTRFGFGSRRYNGSRTTSTAPAFAGAPDYFNEAVGDINIAEEKPRGGKRKIIIGAIIATVAIAIVCVSLCVLSQPKMEAKNLREAVNMYGNYLLTGEESTKDLPESIEIDDTVSYHVGYVDASDNKEEKEQYFSKLYTYYEYINNYYKQNKNEKYNTEILSSSSVQFLGNAVYFFRHIDGMEENTNIDIYTYYRNNGEESAKRYINNIFRDYVSSDNSIVKDYFKTKKGVTNEMKKLAKIAFDADCITSQNVESCLLDRKDGTYERAVEVREDIARRKKSLQSFRANLLDTLILRVIEMSNEIRRVEQ